jgi:hypothetical protein
MTVRKLTRIPISATTAWVAAVEAADCRCQCTTAVKGHTHARTEGRCRTVQGTAGGRLHLLDDGTVLCHPCANHRENTARKTTPTPDPTDLGQESLFDLAT